MPPEDKRNIIDEMKGMDEDRIRMIYNKQALPFAVCVVNIVGGLNMGVIVRNANFFGASKVFYCGRKHWNRVSAVGSYNYTSVQHLPDIADLKALKDEYRFVGVENNIRHKSYSAFNYTPYPNSLYIFGEEGTGLNDELLDLCDDIIQVPNELGTVRSLNVSACSGIILAEHHKKAKTMRYKVLNYLRGLR